MLVTFRTKAWNNITVFGDVAQHLLRMAGHSGSIPGAFDADGVAQAHTNLTKALVAAQAQLHDRPPPAEDDEEHEAKPVDLAIRLGADHPLVHLLEAAVKQHCEVMWSAGAPVL